MKSGHSQNSIGQYQPVTRNDLAKLPVCFRGFTESIDLGEWNELGRFAFDLLPEDERTGSHASRRIHHLMLPVFFWSRSLHSLGDTKLIGLSAPQGAGKTTITRSLVSLFSHVGVDALAVSIDDFYLTRQEQIALANGNPGNPFLQQRGYPGTHDIELGVKVLEKLKSHASGETILVPRYDKALHQGQGDRANPSEWTRLERAPGLVFLEGWMLAFKPGSIESSEKARSEQEANLQQIDRHLAYYEAWQKLLDALIILKPAQSDFVLRWRVEAEEKMKSSGKSGMSRAEIEAYIQKFLPAYDRYLPALPESGAAYLSLPGQAVLSCQIGFDRLPVPNGETDLF